MQLNDMKKSTSLRLLGGTIATISLVGLGERIADPFNSFGNNYVIEGPQSHDGPFYASINWYDEEGKKHNDRTGDALILSAIGGGLVALGALDWLAARSRNRTQA